MPILFDTNILVYRFDVRFPDKRDRARDVLRAAIAEGEGRLAHQNVVEFVAAVTRPLSDLNGKSLLSPDDSTREVEELLRQFAVWYPCAGQIKLAIRGWRSYGLSWFDAHLWSFAEYYGADILVSEGFQHGRIYGEVKVENPFL